MSNKILRTTAAFLLFSGTAFAMEFGGARPMGMGNAFTAFQGDVNAVYHNPAGIAGMDIPELYVNSGYFREDEWSGSLAGVLYAWPLRSPGGRTAALQWNTYYDGKEYVRQAGLTFSWKDVSQADAVSYGTTLKWREDTLRRVQAGLVDCGIQKEWKAQKITGGVAVRNLLSPDQHSALMAPSAGLSHRTERGNINADVTWYTDGPYFSGGVERNVYRDLMVLRCGYLGAPAPLYTLGASARLEPFGFDVSFSWPADGDNKPGYFQLALLYRFSGKDFLKTYINWDEYQEQERKKREAQTKAAAEAARRAAEAAAREREANRITWPHPHKVQPGDTLRSLAQRYYGNANKWQVIYNANADKIERGQPKAGATLILPAP